MGHQELKWKRGDVVTNLLLEVIGIKDDVWVVLTIKIIKNKIQIYNITSLEYYTEIIHYFKFIKFRYLRGYLCQ